MDLFDERVGVFAAVVGLVPVDAADDVDDGGRVPPMPFDRWLLLLLLLLLDAVGGRIVRLPVATPVPAPTAPALEDDVAGIKLRRSIEE